MPTIGQCKRFLINFAVKSLNENLDRRAWVELSPHIQSFKIAFEDEYGVKLEEFHGLPDDKKIQGRVLKRLRALALYLHRHQGWDFYRMLGFRLTRRSRPSGGR